MNTLLNYPGAKCTAQYIARISYGKDSLKMLDVIHSRGLPLDRITTTDVWATDTISANLPPVEKFKARMDERIFQLYGIKVEHLCARNPDGSKKTYEQMFYHVPVRRSQTLNVEREREREREAPARNNPRFPGSVEPVVSSWTQTDSQCTACKEQSPDSHQTPGTTGVRSSKYPSWGKIKGWPLSNKRLQWCQHLKTRVSHFSSERGITTRKDRNIVEYLGIAADEPKRFGQLNEKKRAPLVEFGIDEDLCGLYCQYNDMLSPSYETSFRDGCWFCHNQGVAQLRHLRKNYPDLWALLMKWDLDSPVSFKADGHTVHDFDRRFQMEDERQVPVGRSFRWDMLDRPPNFIAITGDQISIF